MFLNCLLFAFDLLVIVILYCFHYFTLSGERGFDNIYIHIYIPMLHVFFWYTLIKFTLCNYSGFSPSSFKTVLMGFIILCFFHPVHFHLLSLPQSLLIRHLFILELLIYSGINYAYKREHMIFVFVSVISVNIIVSNFIYFPTNDLILFIFKAK
jgi:hypothetical protein